MTTAVEAIKNHKEQIKALEEAAVAELKLEKQKYEAEIKSIQDKIADIENQISEYSPAIITEVVTKKRTRQTFPKLTDAEIKAKLDSVLAVGSKYKTDDILKILGTSRVRLELFKKNNPTFFKIEKGKAKKDYRLLLNK